MSENPLKSDQKLEQLLKDVGSIQTGEGLLEWKASFLKAYKSYLDPDGVLNAREADDRLVKILQGLALASLQVQRLFENGNISTTQVTAEGRRGLGNWIEQMTLAEKTVATFCPKTRANVDKVGYDKFELGAVLIQDGLRAYEIMLTNRDFIQEMTNGPLQGILDKNHLSIISFYSNVMQSFVDIMSDLGLMKLMTKCVSVYQDEARPDRSNEPDLLVESDTDEVVVDENLEKVPDKHGSKSKGSNTLSKGKAGEEKKKSKSGKKTRGVEGDNPAGPPKDDQEEDEPPPQDGDGGEGAKIIYFDPKTGSIGLLEREKCMANDLIFARNSDGRPENNGVIDRTAEKDNLVWLLKKLEKTKPKEGEWLQKIKKDKAKKAREGDVEKPSVRITKDSATGSQAKEKPKRPVTKLSTSKDVGQKPVGFKNPLEESSGPKKNKCRVRDYQGIYKKGAEKPDESGWNKVAPDDKSED